VRGDRNEKNNFEIRKLRCAKKWMQVLKLGDFLSASKLATLITLPTAFAHCIKVTSSLANLLSHYSTVFGHCYRSNIIIIIISNSAKMGVTTRSRTANKQNTVSDSVSNTTEGEVSSSKYSRYLLFFID
jgi:hypothetical protein